jgi:adenylate cyclase class 2
MTKRKPDIEIEYKFKVDNKQTLISLLDKKSQKKKPREYQSNVMFDNPQKLMQRRDGRIRVRTLGNTGNKTLTYKKPLASENWAKREVEYEIHFADISDQIEKILTAMEFTPTTSYERYRTEWQISGTHVTLDEYPFADFIEVEGIKEKIESLAKELGFETKQGLTKPADTLFQEWRKERGLGFKPHMSFDDFDK